MEKTKILFDTQAKLEALCSQAVELENYLAAFNLSFLSKEGLILCSAVENTGRPIKHIINVDNISYRAANMAINAFVDQGFFVRSKSTTDGRSTLLSVNFGLLDFNMFCPRHLPTTEIGRPAFIKQPSAEIVLQPN